MALYRKARSPYWYYDVSSADGLIRLRKSTKIRHDAPTLALQKQNRAAATLIEHQAYAKLATERATGHTPRPAITFKDFAAWYRANVLIHHEGKDRAASRVEMFVRAFGARPLSSLTRADVQEWVTTRLKQVKPLTVWTDIALLKPLFQAAVPKYLETSPLAGFAVPRGTPKERHVLTLEHEAKLYRVMGPRDRMLVLTALHTLLRLGDLLRLTWGDDRGTHFIVQRTKNKRPHRALISAELRRALDRFRGTASDADLLFRAAGKSTAPALKYVSQMFQRACKKAGVPYGAQPHGVTFHSLRHTGATRFIAAGGNIRELQRHGNWKSLQHLTTYTHPDEDAIRQTIAKFTVPSSVPQDR